MELEWSYGSGFIILQFLEKELRENLGSILDFLGILNQSEL